MLLVLPDATRRTACAHGWSYDRRMRSLIRILAGALAGHGSRVVDDVAAWPTVEPAIDFGAAALALSATQP